MGTKRKKGGGGALKEGVSDRMTPEELEREIATLLDGMTPEELEQADRMTPEEFEREMATLLGHETTDTKKKGAKRKVGKKVVEEVDGITLKEPAKRKVGKKVKVKKGDGITLKEPAEVVIDAKRAERTGVLSGLDAIRAKASWRI